MHGAQWSPLSCLHLPKKQTLSCPIVVLGAIRRPLTDLSKPDKVQSILWSVAWATVVQTMSLCANRRCQPSCWPWGSCVCLHPASGYSYASLPPDLIERLRRLDTPHGNVVADRGGYTDMSNTVIEDQFCIDESQDLHASGNLSESPTDSEFPTYSALVCWRFLGDSAFHKKPSP